MVITFIVCTVKEIQLIYACLKSFVVPFCTKSSWESYKELTPLKPGNLTIFTFFQEC